MCASPACYLGQRKENVMNNNDKSKKVAFRPERNSERVRVSAATILFSIR